MIPWWAGSLIANVAIMAIEYFNHTSPYGTWIETLLKRTGVLIIIAQWGLYTSFSGASHWLLAWAVFTVGNSGCRLLAVYWLQSNQVGSWLHIAVGTTIMVLGSFLIKAGLR